MLEVDEEPLKVAGCPNISNPYHECSEYCKHKWSDKQVSLNVVYH